MRKSPSLVQSLKILRFIPTSIALAGLVNYTSVVVINVWLSSLTGYVLRRRQNNVLIMEVQKSIVAHPATGHSQEYSNKMFVYKFCLPIGDCFVSVSTTS